MRRSVAEVGSLDPDTAWERYAVLAAWSSWAPPIMGVTATAERLAPGISGQVHGPLGLRIPFEVLAVDEDARTWSWRVAVGPATAVLHHAVLAGPGDTGGGDGPVSGAGSGSGSVATLTVDGPVPVALVYPDLARVALHRLVSP